MARRCRSPKISIRSVTSVRAVSTKQLRKGVRSRAAGRDPHCLDADGGKDRIERVGELPGPVADQEPQVHGAVAEVHQEVADLLGSPRAGTVPAEVTTDSAPAYPRVLDELISSALHTVERYANNPVEADHGRLKARLRPMRGLKRHRSARIVSAGHAFVQNLRRGHYELATDVPARHRLHEAFDQLAMAI
jgi:hypothetical protein